MGLHLERTRRYELRIGAEEFERLLAAREDVEVRDGPPPRVGDLDHPLGFVAWRVSSTSFVISRRGLWLGTGGLATPAVGFEFEAGTPQSAVRVRARRHLRPVDALDHGARGGLAVVDDVVARLSTWLAYSGLAAIAALILWRILPWGIPGLVASIGFFVLVQVRLLRWHVKHRRVDPTDAVWRRDHDELSRLVGEVLTPHLTGDADASVYRALDE